MSESVLTENVQHGSQLKPYSCLICRQRKIKCDRRDPCSNCTKSEKRCSFVPPVRGKRKVTKSRREGLHAKVKRYEELLKSYGATVEPTEHDHEHYDDDSDVETSVNPDVEMTESGGLESRDLGNTAAPEEIRPKFIMKEGSSRYFERYVCVHARLAVDLAKIQKTELFRHSTHGLFEFSCLKTVCFSRLRHATKQVFGHWSLVKPGCWCSSPHPFDAKALFDKAGTTDARPSSRHSQSSPSLCGKPTNLMLL